MKKIYKPKNTILTAGPSISTKEIQYVTDAVTHGWGINSSDYVKRFEKKFAEYIGTKHALVTSGGTGALHLALACLEIGPGDEVILPEITYFACSDVIMLLGAKPVFADILPDTWCINPKDIVKKITKRTKAIMPVHIYGNLCDMDEIMKIAKKYKIFVVEDACPAIGSTYKGKNPGSFGNCGAFSFQGAKIMVTGVGGMIVTNDTVLFKKIEYLNNHGEDSTKKFWQTSVGYTYEMSNIQAALGLAQLERIDLFVKKKRQIFDWYYQELKNMSGLSLNIEKKQTKSNRWMTSIILNKDFGISRDQLIQALKERDIDSRPFFYPISMFPMYNECNTPIAHHVALNGINLPSGLNLSRKEIKYISQQVIDILKHAKKS